MQDIVLVMLLIASCAALSGFYYDNGLDQTVVHKHLNKREKKEMQSEILHLLGLEHRPRPVSVLPSNKRRKEIRDDDNLSSAPRFLIDVYQSLAEEDDSGDLKLKPELIEREFNVSDSDVSSMDEADVIMSFVNQGQHLHVIRHHHSDGRFWFDLSEVPNPTAVISAELRLFVSTSAKDEDSSPKDFAVTLYEIGEKDSLVYVDRMQVHGEREGWISFNVSLVLKHWLTEPEDNFGLQLVCRLDSTGRQISSKEAGFVGSHGNEKLRPFMVAFFRAHSTPTAHVNSFIKENDGRDEDGDDEEDEDEDLRKVSRTRRQARKNRKRSKDSDDYGSWNPYTELDARLSTRRSCQKKNLYVSFRDLGWQDWIIAPDGYAAFYCNGECSFPLNAHMNASNHAIVQTLVHLMNPYKVPKPCCAPIKLSSISVLYFDDNSNVILKKYRNMVVKSCGCH